MRIFSKMKTIVASLLIVSVSAPAVASMDFGVVCDLTDTRSVTNIENHAPIYWGQERDINYPADPRVTGFVAYDCNADVQIRFEDVSGLDYVLIFAKRSLPLMDIARDFLADGVVTDTGPVQNRACMCDPATLELANSRLTDLKLET